MAFEADKRVRENEMHHRDNSGECHRDSSAPGGSSHTHAGDIDEEVVEEDIDQCAANHDPHSLEGVAAGADEAREVVGESDEEHAGEDDVHIEAGRVDGLGGGAEEGEDRSHPDIAGGNEQETKDEGEEHGVAEDFLSPADILAAEDDAHAGASAGADEGAEGVDDVHHGEGDGKGGEVDGAHAVAGVAEEDTVDNVVDRGDDLASDSGEGVFPEETANGLGF